MREIAIKSIIAFLLLAARVALAQGATTFLSNIGQSSSGSLSVGSDSWIAGGFETGTNVSGYILDSIQLGMASSTGTPSGFTVMLYEDAGSPAGLRPGSSLGTFVGSLDPASGGTYTYTAPEELILSAGSSYYIVVTAGTPEATGAYQWSDTGANNYNPTDGFFDIGAGVVWFSSNGTVWNDTRDNLQYALIGSLAPEPGVMGLLAVGGLGMMWWTKRARGARLGARGKKV